jgi:hypothetical protein
MRKAVLTVFILLFPGTLFAFWPVYWELDGQKNLLGPLFSYEQEGEKTHVTVRPLLSSYDSPRTYSFLWPLGKSTEEKAYFLPLYMRHTSGEKNDVALFPFFWGNTGERSYGGVFPFYGKLYNRFRRDEIGFFLWPLYTYSKWDDTERTNVLWPIFSFYSGKQEGYKLGPVYGERRWGDERKSMFVLWPFFIRDERGLDTDEPKKSLWVIPFYLQTDSPKSSFRAVLWPFFTYNRTEDKTELKAPWPLYSRTTGKQESGFGVWPIYSYSRTERDETTYVLWPIYKGVDKYLDDTHWTQKRILLINRYNVDDRGAFFNIWPFFEYRRAGDAKSFYFPSIIPFRNEGCDRIIKPLFTLYEYRQTEDKTISNLLYGFYTKEQHGKNWKRRLAFLFEIKREPEGFGFEILSGVFGIDSRHLKILFVPINREAEGDSASTPADRPDAESTPARSQSDPISK